MPLPQILPTDIEEAYILLRDEPKISQIAQYLANFRHMENLEIERKQLIKEGLQAIDLAKTNRCTAENWKKRFEDAQEEIKRLKTAYAAQATWAMEHTKWED